VLLVCVLLRSFLPAIILPQLSIPNMVLLSLVALLLDHYLTGGGKRCWLWLVPLSALTFGLLPWCACLAGGWEALKLAAVGCVTFTATAWLYTSIQDRLASGPVAKAAPILSALGLYLAAQCFMGII
jgi:hypothetical protein